MDYLYDGSFEGLLCCVFAHYYEEKAEGIFERGVYQQSMLRRARYIETEGNKAVRVYDAVREKLSPESLRRIYAVYLSSEEEKEMKILRYLVLGFRVGKQINLLHADPAVFDVQQIERKIYAERHRYLGILRFSVIAAASAAGEAGAAVEAAVEATVEAAAADEAATETVLKAAVKAATETAPKAAKSAPSEAAPAAERASAAAAALKAQAQGSKKKRGGQAREVLYATLEPDHDIIELMAGHFADRYRNDPFILHDIRREKAVFAKDGHWYVAALPKESQVSLAAGEREYRKLWKQYFETIAIKERTNPRCQKQYMPVRYWKHLTEMRD